MRVTFDLAKNARNTAERGLPFLLVADLDRAAATVDEISFRKANRREVQHYEQIRG